MDLQRFYKKAKLFKLIYFLVNNTEYKGTQLLCGMDLQSFNNSSLPTLSHSFKTTIIFITTNIEKNIFWLKHLLKFNFLYFYLFIWYMMHLLTFSYPQQYAKMF